MAKKNQTKYRLICEGAQHLTTYNKEFNKKVECHCFQDPKFEPRLNCLTDHPEDAKCRYLESKKLN